MKLIVLSELKKIKWKNRPPEELKPPSSTLPRALAELENRMRPGTWDAELSLQIDGEIVRLGR